MSKKLGVQDVPRRTAHQVAAPGNAIMLRPEPNCTSPMWRPRRCTPAAGGSGAARAVTDSRQSPGGTLSSTLLCSAIFLC